jgi:hypothetical protein
MKKLGEQAVSVLTPEQGAKFHGYLEGLRAFHLQSGS